MLKICCCGAIHLQRRRKRKFVALQKGKKLGRPNYTVSLPIVSDPPSEEELTVLPTQIMRQRFCQMLSAMFKFSELHGISWLLVKWPARHQLLCLWQTPGKASYLGLIISRYTILKKREKERERLKHHPGIRRPTPLRMHFLFPFISKSLPQNIKSNILLSSTLLFDYFMLSCHTGIVHQHLLSQ